MSIKTAFSVSRQGNPIVIITFNTKYSIQQQHTSTLKKSGSIRSHLHKVTRHECLADVDVVVSAGEVGARPSQIEPIHDT